MCVCLFPFPGGQHATESSMPKVVCLPENVLAVVFSACLASPPVGQAAKEEGGKEVWRSLSSYIVHRRQQSRGRPRPTVHPGATPPGVHRTTQKPRRSETTRLYRLVQHRKVMFRMAMFKVFFSSFLSPPVGKAVKLQVAGCCTVGSACAAVSSFSVLFHQRSGKQQGTAMSHGVWRLHFLPSAGPCPSSAQSLPMA